jgi:phosphoribosylaminoimidazole (AIR) synthetase
MYRVFNMGLGMVAICQEGDVDALQQAVSDAVVVGRIVTRNGDEPVLLQ